MGRGWDFIKVGGTYQYKEDWLICEVTVLEDNSDDKYYKFKLQVEKCNLKQPPNSEYGIGIFEITYIKKISGFYSGMLQFFEKPCYTYTPKWKRNED